MVTTDVNYRIETTADKLAKAEPVVELAEDEDAKPKPSHIDAAKKTAVALASTLGAKSKTQVTVQGHETTEGKGFKPAHIMVTVSRVE